MQKGRLILHAPGVHIGGGLVILKELLSKINTTTTVICIDERAVDILQDISFLKISIIKHTIFGRIKAEYNLRKLFRNGDTLLCFHGLPPLFINYGNIVVYEQNRLHIESTSLTRYPIKTRIRLNVERSICRLLKNRVKQYVVQTKSMHDALIKWHGNNPTALIFPIMRVPDEIATIVNFDNNKKYDLVYVADGSTHKNHNKLILALVLLSKESIFPTLRLTIPNGNDNLVYYIKECVEKYNIKVTNLGELPHEKIWDLYQTSKALIFPSTLESFGLPLLEASKIGLPIIAAEKDYVRDVCVPKETFDPQSPISISRAIKRFLNIQDIPVRQRNASMLFDVIGVTSHN